MSGADFYKFPSTPHLLWLGRGDVRDDKVMDRAQAEAFLRHDVVVEEKVDGANLGISFDAAGVPHFQNRGKFVDPGHGQFKGLRGWFAPRAQPLQELLGDGLILFGEWCQFVHSIHYTRLPDLFLGFDVYDTAAAAFWSTPRRNALFAAAGIHPVPAVGAGRYTLAQLPGLIGPSALFDGRAEGVYLRHESDRHLLARAKVVHPDFTQSIEAHWSAGGLRPNGVVRGE